MLVAYSDKRNTNKLKITKVTKVAESESQSQSHRVIESQTVTTIGSYSKKLFECEFEGEYPGAAQSVLEIYNTARPHRLSEIHKLYD